MHLNIYIFFVFFTLFVWNYAYKVRHIFVVLVCMHFFFLL